MNMDLEDSGSLFHCNNPNSEPNESVVVNSEAQFTIRPLNILLEDCINLLRPNPASMEYVANCEDRPSLSSLCQPDPSSPLWSKSQSLGCYSESQKTPMPLKKVKVLLEDCRKMLGPNAQSIKVDVMDRRESTRRGPPSNG
ncbi:hypothetical protein DPEC_G00314520 [Dallia pectoralis]|uniref:Uncharacterized protein n=1 Tax=Dallia pectoralis TaxID=75939 RepID=A0ACC2FCE7_DALPE|nr:hypothetical protein DPEC_G00314520 [Dallia pectoralis]